MARRQLIDDEPMVEKAAGGSLHTKYRPSTLQAVFGQKDVVASVSAALKADNKAHAYLFTGPAGTGKTTMARIVAARLGVTGNNILEVDAATHTGIDAMRDVTDTLKYKGFGDSQRKMVIIDEAHMLSKQAWASLLKVVEEPPSHVFFALCTTDAGKVPETIATRCLRYTLRSLHKDDLWDLAEMVCKEEGYRTPEDVMSVLVAAADGSPRKLLTGLAAVYDCKDAREAAAILAQPFEDPEVIELCRMIVNRSLKNWPQVTSVISRFKDDNPEGLRLVIVNYLQAVLLKSADDKKTQYLLDCLSQFMRPTTGSEKLAPLLIAFGNIVYN